MTPALRLSLASLIPVLACVSMSEAGTRIGKIEVAASVPADQVQRLQKDLQALNSMQLGQADPAMLTLMGIGESSSSSVVNWLEDRVRYIVDNDFDLQKAVSVSSSRFDYPNPGVLPEFEKPTRTPSKPTGNEVETQSKVQIMMANVGGALYMVGKKMNLLLEVDLPGIGKKAATSPRLGLLQVGSGMFANMFGDPTVTPDSNPALAMRLSTLIHEAHHSDGNGKSLSFMHAVCPSGVYEGYSACDRNLNGPYAVEASFSNTLILSCKDCSEKDTALMQAISADAASRQIAVTVTSDPLVADEISAIQTLLHACKVIGDLDPKAEIPECQNLAARRQRLEELERSQGAGVPSTVWDATPEGEFNP